MLFEGIPDRRKHPNLHEDVQEIALRMETDTYFRGRTPTEVHVAPDELEATVAAAGDEITITYNGEQLALPIRADQYTRPGHVFVCMPAKQAVPA